MRTSLLALVFLFPVAAHAQDIAAGEKVFQACRPCHQVGATARSTIGPALNGFFGRKAATVEGFPYSDALRSSGIVWDDETFGEFMMHPRTFVRGTKMTSPGVSEPDKIANLIAYLKQFDATGKIAPAQAAGDKPPKSAAVATVPPAPADADTLADPAIADCLKNLGAAAGPGKCAAVGGELLEAQAIVTDGALAANFGAFAGGVLVFRNNDDNSRFFQRFAPSKAEPCVAEELSLSQEGKREWAEVSEVSFDFRKLKRLLYLIKADDYTSDVSPAAHNPKVVQVALEGESWICTNMISLDKKEGASGRTCQNRGIPIDVSSPEHNAVVLSALEIIRKTCGVPK